MSKMIIKDNFNNKLKITDVFNNLFSKKIYKYRYLGICKLKKMPEYNFKLSIFNVMLEDYTNYTVFIKRISKQQIEETLFCYWLFCEKNYNTKGNFYLQKARLKSEKVIQNNDYIQKYILNLLSKNNKIWKASNIYIVDLKKMNSGNFFDIEEKRKMKSDINTNDYLFVGII